MNHLTPRQAYDFLLAHPEAVFVDCRSEAEYFLVGHALVERPGEEPLRPHNICWADELKYEVNPDFVEDVRQVAGDTDRPVVIICRSGRRSVSAGQALEVHVARQEFLRQQERHGHVVVERRLGRVPANDVPQPVGKLRQDRVRRMKEFGGDAEGVAGRVGQQGARGALGKRGGIGMWCRHRRTNVTGFAPARRAASLLPSLQRLLTIRTVLCRTKP